MACDSPLRAEADALEKSNRKGSHICFRSTGVLTELSLQPLLLQHYVDRGRPLKTSKPNRKAKRDGSEYRTNGSFENQTPVGA